MDLGDQLIEVWWLIAAIATGPALPSAPRTLGPFGAIALRPARGRAPWSAPPGSGVDDDKAIGAAGTTV
ncbi:MAG: hypothetical protein NTW02_02880 [Cyanobium sp. LacPavin_0920_WC12_MAG_62_9]|nr:hypothetical protein [Cyanobium sp. LacPavin_0920_WC12_MAG_62_9]